VSENPSTTSSATRPVRAGVAGVFAVAVIAGSLITYKASTAIAALSKAQVTGVVARKAEWLTTTDMPAWLKPIAGTLNYFVWVMIALAFGVVLGAAIKALVPDRWLLKTIGRRGMLGHVVAALSGAPLMLCSCCIAPIFEGVFERTRRLGPSLGIMMASPALNPAALALTFLVFPARLAWARVVLSLVIVFVASAGIGALVKDTPTAVDCPVDWTTPSLSSLGRGFVKSLREVSRRSLPAIALGVLASMALAGVLPISDIARLPMGAILTTLCIAVAAVPLALPTFAEIPIALALVEAGAPEGAVLAILVAGPVINLPSLLTIRKVVSARAALATAAAVFIVVASGSLVLQL
jgi:uncharacterized protein